MVDFSVIFLSVVHAYQDGNLLAGPAVLGARFVVTLEAAHDVGTIFLQAWAVGVEKGKTKAFVF